MVDNFHTVYLTLGRTYDEQENAGHVDSVEARNSQLRVVDLLLKKANELRVNLKFDENFFPPEAMISRIDNVWRVGSKNPGHPSHKTSIPLRDIIQRRIFEPLKPNGAPNANAVMNRDERTQQRVMRILEAMIDEYVLCHHLEVNFRSQGLTIPQCIRTVRADVAKHYADLLQETGFTMDETVKIVGNGIRAFMDAMTRAGYKAESILPSRTQQGITANDMLVCIGAYAGQNRRLTEKIVRG